MCELNIRMINYFQGQDGFVWFTGVVEDRNDPTKLGRVRVRCVGYHTDDKTKIPTEDLPWAWVLQTVHTPSMNGCLLYTSPSPRDKRQSRMPSSA